MEVEYRDPSRRGRWIVVIGVILALVAGGSAFVLINNAQQRSGQADIQKVSVVVAVQTIPARKIIEPADVVVREVPLDGTNAQGIVSTPEKVIGRIPSVTILAGQMVLTNLLASSASGSSRSSGLTRRWGRTRSPGGRSRSRCRSIAQSEACLSRIRPSTCS